MTPDPMPRRAAEEEGERTMLRRPAAPPADPDPVLHVLELAGPELPPRRLVLGPEVLTIGRAAPCGLVLPSPEISRAHCSVAVEGEAAVLRDLGSTNGTLLDGLRIAAPTRLATGARLRLGPFTLTYRAGRAAELDHGAQFERELARAGRYIAALLPPPLAEGPIRVDWRFLPSARIGGDGFGYAWLAGGRFAVWLLDVSGHGAGSAPLAASAMNILREHSLPGVDFADPAAVLNAANARFQMDRQDGLYFSLWYGVFDPATRVLAFGCAGHHPAFLVRPGAAPAALWVKAPAIGLAPAWAYRAAEAALPGPARLHLFSDGAFEIMTPDGRQLGLRDFVAVLGLPPAPGLPEPERLLRHIRAIAQPGPLADDVALLTLDFL